MGINQQTPPPPDFNLRQNSLIKNIPLNLYENRSNKIQARVLTQIFTHS